MNEPRVPFRKVAAILALALGAAVSQVHAAPQIYTLAGVAEDGPLAGSAFSGRFAFDGAVLSGVDAETVLLDWVDIEVFGQRYGAESMSYTPTASFFDGVLLGIDLLHEGRDSGFAFVSGFFALEDAYFAYFVPQGAGFGSLTVSPVPEPPQALTLLAGLGLIGGVMRRRIMGRFGSA